MTSSEYDTRTDGERGLWTAIRRMLARRGTNDAGEIWAGTGFPSVLASVSAAVQGLDGDLISHLGDQAFAQAREAYRTHRPRLAIANLQIALALYMNGGARSVTNVINNLAMQYGAVGETPTAIRLHRLAIEYKIAARVAPEVLDNSVVQLANELWRIGSYDVAARELDRAAGFAAERGLDVSPQIVALKRQVTQRATMKTILDSAFAAALNWDNARLDEFDEDLRAVLEYLEQNTSRYRERECDRWRLHAELGTMLYREPTTMFAEAVAQFRLALEAQPRAADSDGHASLVASAAAAAAEVGDLAQQIPLLTALCTMGADDDPARVRAALQLTVALLRADDERTARHYLDLAFMLAASSFPESGYEIVKHALVFRNLELLDVAELCFRYPVARLDAPPGLVRTARIGLGRLLLMRGAVQEARSTLEENLRDVDDVPDDDRAKTLVELGNVHLERGDLEAATETMNQLLDLSEHVQSPGLAGLNGLQDGLIRLAAASRNAHDVLKEVLADPALAATSKGKDAIIAVREIVANASLGEDREREFRARSTLSSLLRDTNQLGEADAEAKRALRECRAAGRLDWYGPLLHEWGVIAATSGRVRLAERLFTAAVRYKDDYCGGDRRWGSLANAVQARAMLGEVARSADITTLLDHLNEIDPANRRVALLQAAELAEEEGRPEDADALAVRSLTESPAPVGARVSLDAQLLRARVAGRRDPTLATRLARAALAEAEEARRSAEPTMQPFVNARIADAAELILDSMWEAGGDAGDAFALVERGRMRGLLEQFGRFGIGSPRDLPESLRSEERILLSALLAEDNRDRYRSSRDALVNLHIDPADSARALREFWLGLPDRWKAYGRVRAGEPLSWPELSALVRNTHPCRHVAFWPTRRCTYVWQISPDGEVVGWKRSNQGAAELETAVRGFNSALRHRARPDPGSAATLRDLVGLAFADLSAGEPVAVVPGSGLIRVAFGAVECDGGYLAERHPIAVLPSASLMAYWALRGPALSSGVAVMGDSLSDLRAARREAQWVAERLRVEPLLREDVSRQHVVAAMRNATLVHIAGHAQHEAIAADRAGFLLSDRTVLSGRDVVELGLQGDVAFLSGCDTGSVDIKRGDELAGLAVGFLRAGYRCVVAAGWPVSDVSTDILVRGVYSAASDATWAQALRSAQRAMIADAAQQHPYHWAGFALWGSAVTNLDVARQRAG
jgi:CHAT domain-containing protein/tetratricopeptide (TPR) repeat protein